MGPGSIAADIAGRSLGFGPRLAQASAESPELFDEFLRLACLTYAGDDPPRWARARDTLEANPQIATAHAVAAVGAVPAARELLARDPSQARAQGGPHQAPRSGVHGNLEMIRLLLEHCADPNTRDRSYDATPAGWAEHHNQTEAQDYLAALEDRSGSSRNGRLKA